MNPCDKCLMPSKIKCCHNCKKDAAKCWNWHKCGEDCEKWEAPIQTNADRIRAMNDSSLASFLVDIGWDCHFCEEHHRLENEPLLKGEKCDEECMFHCENWLKQPAEVAK